jgi:hypothetical protein
MSCLAPCPACNRHVATDAAACPFCAATLPDSFRCEPTRQPRRGRLSRAGLLAAGAALIGIGQACGGSAYGTSPPPKDAAADTGTMDGSAVALYGAPAAAQDQAPPANGAAPPAKKANNKT